MRLHQAQAFCLLQYSLLKNSFIYQIFQLLLWHFKTDGNSFHLSVSNFNVICGAKYSRMDQVKIFKGYLPQI